MLVWGKMDDGGVTTMTEQEAPKKISLQEAAKRMLAEKKEAQKGNKEQQKQQQSGVQKMKHQQTKGSGANLPRRSGGG